MPIPTNPLLKQSVVIRVLSVTALILLLFLTSIGALWFFAYALDDAPPTSVPLDVLAQPVEIEWLEGDIALVQAGTDQDLLTGLGYVHGMRRAWLVTLWRQVALGALGQWFDGPIAGIDSLAHQLAWATTAQRAHALLPQGLQSQLDAYTAGFNAALFDKRTLRLPPFVFLGQTPDPWEPWHTLALERLFAWLATVPPAPTDDPTLQHFLDTDQHLRQLLHLYGFEHSLALTRSLQDLPVLYQRHVYGDLALPFFQEVLLRRPGRADVSGATVPGTPFFPAGGTDTHAWSVLLTGTYTFEQRSQHTIDSTFTQHDHRYFNPLGEETLLTTYAADSLLLLSPVSDNPQDLRWVLRWAGLQHRTDIDSWLHLPKGDPLPFQLIDGVGLWLGTDGQHRTLGSPKHVLALGNDVMVAQTDWALEMANRLDQSPEPALPRPPLSALTDDYYSTWAMEVAPALITSVNHAGPPSPLAAEGLAYLRNWDHAFDPSSIAASIFDAWVTAHKRTLGRWPEADLQALTPAGHRQRFQLFEQVIADLTQRLGPDMGQWQWSRVNPHMRSFPIWSDTTLRVGRSNTPPHPKYAPITRLGGGHPTTPRWGPSAMLDTPPAPALWEGWIQLRATGHPTVATRSDPLETDGFLHRYLLLPPTDDARTLSDTLMTEHQTRLLPQGAPSP